MTTQQTPSTANKAWGFFGTIRPHAEPTEAWGIALPAIAAAAQASPDAARAFLDSRQGRHFAGDVANSLAGGLTLPAAVEAATGRWMGWRISKRTEQETGIPAGLPYLTGFVMDAEIAAALA